MCVLLVWYIPHSNKTFIANVTDSISVSLSEILEDDSGSIDFIDEVDHVRFLFLFFLRPISYLNMHLLRKV